MPLAPVHFQRKRRTGFGRIRWRHLAVPLEAGFCLCAAGLFLYALFHYARNSPAYQVRHIVVYGASAVTPAEVRQASGVTTADNLLFLDRETVATQVAQLAYVASADVQRELPNTLIITLDEREPVAALLAGTRSYLLDREAVVLAECDPAAPLPGPLITNVPGVSSVSVGQKLEAPALLEALKLWEAYAAAPIAGEVTLSEISAPGPLQLTMFWEEVPFEVRWGRSDYAKQAERLSALWREKAGQLPCLEYLDLRFDQDLVCR